MREQAAADGCLHRTFRCSPYHANSALYPIMDHLERRLSFQPGEEPREKLVKLERFLTAHVLPLEETVPLLAAFLGLDASGRYTPLRLAPQLQRPQTFNILISWLLEEAKQQPMLIVWEDLHWADPSTIELLSLLIEHIPSAPMLTLLTFRPDFRPPWAMAAHLAQLTLNRFGPQQVERLVTHVAGGKPLPRLILSQIVAQTDGVPLFVEELTKSVLESPLVQEGSDHCELVGALPSLTIPATLQDALMARLDRLHTGKTVAQIGATLGRTFAYPLLQAVSDLGQAQELCHRLGDPPQLFPILYGLVRARYNRAEHDLARRLGTRLLRVAETRPEPTLLVAAHTILAAIEVTAGRLDVAMPHLETANALYDRSQHGDLVTRFATDNGIVSGNFTMWALWCLGYPDRALKRGIENTSLAEELGHPLTLAMTYCFRAVAHQYRREEDGARKWAEAAMAISSKHGFAQWLGMGRLLEGWSKGVEKRPHQHLQQMVEGLAMWRSAGAEGFVPYGLGLLAEAYGQENRTEEGLRTVDTALEQVERTNERQWEAELQRIRGHLILLKTTGPAADQAETCFLQALGVSRRQQAKSLELRAAVSLADLWRRQGKRAPAHDLLAPIHGWFTEGFDTADLQDARTLLEDLT